MAICCDDDVFDSFEILADSTALSPGGVAFEKRRELRIVSKATFHQCGCRLASDKMDLLGNGSRGRRQCSGRVGQGS